MTDWPGGLAAITMLDVAAAPGLIEPARVGDRDGQRFVFTLEVDDVDERCQ